MTSPTTINRLTELADLVADRVVARLGNHAPAPSGRAAECTQCFDDIPADSPGGVCGECRPFIAPASPGTPAPGGPAAERDPAEVIPARDYEPFGTLERHQRLGRWAGQVGRGHGLKPLKVPAMPGVSWSTENAWPRWTFDAAVKIMELLGEQP